MRIRDMEMGAVYAHAPGNTSNIEPIVLLDLNIYIVTAKGNELIVRPVNGREKKSPKVRRGLLALPAPAEVWELAREGQDLTGLPSVDRLYSQKLIITDNLPSSGTVAFDRTEFAGVKVVWPSHIPGLFEEHVAIHDARKRAREEAHTQKAAEERAIRNAFEILRERAEEAGLGTPVLKGLDTVEISLESFHQLMTKPRRRR